jgi:hypothetical protein
VIRAAYLVKRPCQVEFLGGAGIPTAILGSVPSNWRVLPYDSVDVRTFLEAQDFFVHYPQQGYVEAFGRSVLEAMASGVPTILAPAFEPTFGEAAMYEAPADVWNRVSNLWSDERAWLDRSEAGRQFVLDTCDLTQFGKRLSVMTGSEAGRQAQGAG